MTDDIEKTLISPEESAFYDALVDIFNENQHLRVPRRIYVMASLIGSIIGQCASDDETRVNALRAVDLNIQHGLTLERRALVQ